LLARAQMYPACPNLYAFFAFAPLRLFNGRDRVEMRAPSVRHCLKWNRCSLRYFENLDLLGNAAK